MVRGGQSMKHKNNWQAGHLVNATWRARLMDHLGSLTGESQRNYAAHLLHVPLGLATLLSALALLESCTAERMAYPALYDALLELLPLDEGRDDLARYIKFECQLLSALGYGLNFSACALTASTRDLSHVSPRTGRAVNREAAAPWLDKLLPLPPFLTRPDIPSWEDIAHGLNLTGHFIEGTLTPHLAPFAQKMLLDKRRRVVNLVASKIEKEKILHTYTGG
jgi:DNA repair protein RecO (recombination protein O)